MRRDIFLDYLFLNITISWVKKCVGEEFICQSLIFLKVIFLSLTGREYPHVHDGTTPLKQEQQGRACIL